MQCLKQLKLFVVKRTKYIVVQYHFMFCVVSSTEAVPQIQ